jgi:type VI secretion system secreted protein Hcp
VAVLVWVLPAGAAVDMFIKIEGIPGESQDEGHKDEIDVLAWSWGMSNSGTTHTGTGGGTGKANFQDLSFVKYVDKASPLLMLSCANGAPVPMAELVVRKAGAEPVEYIKIRMENILVSSVSTGGSGGEDRLTENVTLNFSKFTYIYTPQDPGTGAGGPPVEFSWDIVLNKEG